MLLCQVDAPFTVERELILPASKDRQALVPCKDVEQRSLDHTFDCPQSRATVPALQSVQIPVSIHTYFLAYWLPVWFA